MLYILYHLMQIALEDLHTVHTQKKHALWYNYI